MENSKHANTLTVRPHWIVEQYNIFILHAFTLQASKSTSGLFHWYLVLVGYLLSGPFSQRPSSLLRRAQYYCWILAPLHPVIDVPSPRRELEQNLVAKDE
jgi:hypothetical protein